MTEPSRVLLIDEDIERRKRLTDELCSRLTTAQVIQIGDGLQYAEQLMAEHFDVAIASNEFSWGSGVDVLNRLKRHHPQCTMILLGKISMSSASATVDVFPDTEEGRSAMLNALAGGGLAAPDPVLRAPTPTPSSARDAARKRRQSPGTVATDNLSQEVAALSHLVSVLAKRRRKDAQESPLVLRMQLACERLSAMAGRLEHDVEFDLGRPTGASLLDALLQSIDILQPVIDGAGARILTGRLPSLLVHKSHLRSLFYHLLDNVIKFRSERAPRATIRAHATTNGWILSVSDNALGIADPQPRNLFDLFTRAIDVRHLPGSGIGLAICRAIVDHYQGHIWYESTLGQGSTFYAQLPVETLRAGERQMRVYHNGVDVGEVRVRSGASRSEIVRATLALPTLHAALEERTIKDVQLLGDGRVNVLS